MPPYAGVPRGFLHAAHGLQFLKPTALLRRLLLLSELDREPRASQRALASCAGISASVANQYLTGFVDEKLATKASVNRRDLSYTLSEAGHAHLTDQVLRYLREVFVLSATARTEIARYLEDLLGARSIERLAIYPAGGVAESVLHALEDSKIDIVALVDDDRAIQGTAIHGVRVFSPDRLDGLQVDAVLVATYQHRARILSRLRSMALDDVKVICL
jgi:hypothetical protein